LALTKVSSDMINPDPTDASNLSSGDVPLAQLGNVPASDTSAIEDDIALLGFKVATAGSMAKYNLVDQTEDAFIDATGIDAGDSVNAVRNAANYYVGQTQTTPTASGGTVTTVGDYTIHSFLSGTTSYTNDTAQSTDILIVAGGGGGGGHDGGGGGAGGFRALAAQAIGTSGATVIVGTGGAGNSSQNQQGGDGTDSSVAIGGGSTLAATGGGGGGSENSLGRTGGSGGGSGQNNTNNGGAGNAGGYTPVEGYRGGAGTADAPRYGGGGGGGASEVGVSNGGQNPDGGDGLQNDYRTGSNVYYAGGGGGSARSGGIGTGGDGGGGNGAAGGGNGSSGSANTGGGGGGGSDSGKVGGVGGSGIVVLKRLTNALNSSDLTLVSNATTAESTATKGDLVMTYTNGAGTATLNTDLTAEFSADNGSNWTPMTLARQGTTGTASPHIIVTAHNVTAGTSGTQMKYRIKTLNQTASKETRIQAVSLGWS
jgi:hypothetical protein